MMPNIPDLTAELWTLVRQIPSGKVASYGDIARCLGDVVASRYVGHAMLHHRHMLDCPCHRLVRMDGTLGRFVTGDTQDKLRALEAEGVDISGGQVNLPRSRFTNFKSIRPPLTLLAEYQRRAAERARCAEISLRPIKRFGGVDVSYVPRTNLAVAAFVEIRWPSCEVIYQQLMARSVEFPYVTSYLAFRELPMLTELLSLVREERSLPDVILVDGSGILHPRRAGIATMLGVACDVYTIGVTKKHLAGRVDLKGLTADGFCDVFMDDQVRGVALSPGSGTSKPLYVSPGYGVNVTTSLSVVQQVLCGRRLPEPIYWADRLSRQAAQRLRLTDFVTALDHIGRRITSVDD